jgi:hypothetical protein
VLRSWRWSAACPRRRARLAQERVWLDAAGRKAKEAGAKLRSLVDEDAAAFDAVVAAYRLPKAGEAEKAKRADAVTAAMRRRHRRAALDRRVVPESAGGRARGLRPWQPQRPLRRQDRRRARVAGLLGALENVRINAAPAAWGKDALRRADALQREAQERRPRARAAALGPARDQPDADRAVELARPGGRASLVAALLLVFQRQYGRAQLRYWAWSFSALAAQLLGSAAALALGPARRAGRGAALRAAAPREPGRLPAPLWLVLGAYEIGWQREASRRLARALPPLLAASSLAGTLLGLRGPSPLLAGVAYLASAFLLLRGSGRARRSPARAAWRRRSSPTPSSSCTTQHSRRRPRSGAASPATRRTWASWTCCC